MLSLLQPASRFEQLRRFVAEADHGRIVAGGHMVDDLLGEMMHVDHETLVVVLSQTVDNDVEERTATHGHQGLRHGVGKRLQASAHARSENHGLLHNGFQPCAFSSNSCPSRATSTWPKRSSVM